MAELGDFSSDSGVSDGTVSVDMCDYGFVDECNDKKKLQGILNLLLSGKEGHYPELIKHTEDKLLTLMTPAEQLKTLRLKKEITPMERIEAESGLSAWESSILSADKSLSRKQGQTLDHVGSIDLHTLPTTTTTSTKSLPPVRGASTPLEVSGTKTENSSECEGVINRKRLSEREKLKGNEFYRVGEVEEAVRCYTRSINFDPTNHILYANRAMGFIKLDALEKAEEDCSKALRIDCTYVKAWSRRGLTRFKRGKYSLSASDFTNALKLDPSNKDIPQLLQKSKDKYLEVEGKGEWKEDNLINKNVVIKDHAFIVVTNTAVSRDEFISFLPPQGHFDCLTHGVYERRNSSEIAPTGTTFARIPITFDDDDDDDDEEDDEEMQEKIKEDEVVVSNSSSRHVQDTCIQGVHVKHDTVVEKEVEKEEDATIYTRITITDEDEEEEEEYDNADDSEASGNSRVEAESDTFSRERNGNADSLGGAVKGEMSGDTHSAVLISTKGSDSVENEVAVDDQFTRIAIVDDDDDDDDDNDNAHFVVNDEQTLHRSNAPQDISKTHKEVVKMAEQGISSTTAVAALTEKKLEEVATTAAALSAQNQLCDSNEKCKMKVGISGEQKKEKEVVKKERGAFEQGGANSKSESLKAAGNEAMKSLDYKSALSLYTASLELDQSNLLTRNNRAQTHLKLLNFKEAVTDATYVIEKDPSYPGTGGLPSGFSPSSVSSAVKKALYRRATAYTSLGGDLLLSALKDLDLLLSFEPGNTLAHSERTKVAVQVREYQSKKGNTAHVDVVEGAPKKGTRAGTGPLGPSVSGPGQVLGGSSKGGEMMAERSSRRITAASRDLEVTNPSGLPSVAPLSSAQVPTIVQPAHPPLASTSIAIAPASNIPVKKPFKREPSVPSEVPKTLYEFERAWRGLKDRPDLFAQYLRQNIHEKSVIRKVFKESISPDLLSATFISLRDHCTAMFSLPFLLSLSSVRHFSMTLALLQEEDIICVRSIINSVCIQRDHKESKSDIKIEKEKEKKEKEEGRDNLGDEIRDIIEQLKLLYKI